MSDYLHGVETEERDEINLTISDADTSAIVVIGTKPTYLLDEVNKIEKVTNFTESANYVGHNIEGFTLPDACETILTESGGADIYTINIFDYDKHSASVSKTITFTDDKCVLEETGIQNLVVYADAVELTEGTDYSFEDNTITILEGGALEALSSDTEITASYTYVDFTKITDSDVIGSSDDEENRTGIQAIYDIIAEYGVIPGIIIAPGFTSKNVRTALATIAEKLKSFAYAEIPAGTTIKTMEKARYNAQEVNGETIDITGSSEYLQLCEPRVYRYNSYQDVTTLKPLTPVVAGLRVKLDRNRSVSKSISNTQTSTTTGREFNRSFMLYDSSTDSNRINALGIMTVINNNGNYYIWGGRNSLYPSETGLRTFECTRRTINFIEHSIEESSFSCVDETITRGFIDDVLNAINAKFASWSSPVDPQKQILLGGEAYWDSSLNTAETLADGHIYFPYKFCNPPVAERITYQGILDITIITDTLSA